MKVSQNAFRGSMPRDVIISNYLQILLDFFPDATFELKHKFESDEEISG